MNTIEIEKVMRIMNIPDRYAHTLSQVYAILENNSEVIDNLRNNKDIDTLFVFIKNEYETLYGEDLSIPKHYLKTIL